MARPVHSGTVPTIFAEERVADRLLSGRQGAPGLRTRAVPMIVATAASQENGKHENRYQQTANRFFCRRFFLAGSNRFFRS